MGYVSRKVYTKSHRYDHIGGSHNVNGQAPEMHETNHINLEWKSKFCLTLLQWLQFFFQTYQIEDDKQKD